MKISLIEACIKWVDESNDRCMDLKKDSGYESNNKIWLYSYGIGDGVHVSSLEDIPTEQSLKKKKRERIEEQLRDLD